MAIDLLGVTQILAAASLAVMSAGVAAGDFSLGLGAEYTRGDYGTGRDTSIWYFPLTLVYDTESWALSATVPYVIVRAPGHIVPGIGGGVPMTNMGSMQVARPSIVGATRTESELGDLVVSGSWRLVAGSVDSPRLDLIGKLKFATADEDGNLDTGENDFAAQLDVKKGVFTAMPATRSTATRLVWTSTMCSMACSACRYRCNPKRASRLACIPSGPRRPAATISLSWRRF